MEFQRACFDGEITLQKLLINLAPRLISRSETPRFADDYVAAGNSRKLDPVRTREEEIELKCAGPDGERHGSASAVVIDGDPAVVRFESNVSVGHACGL